MNFKEQVYNQYQQIITDKINVIKIAIADLRSSSANETKSSAGDKYETARAMLQIEIDQLGKQLVETLTQKAILDKIDIQILSKKIVNGSLVKTNRGYLFLSIASGKTVIAGETIVSLSPQSPLGLKLMGLKVKDEVQVNNNIYLVEEIS